MPDQLFIQVDDTFIGVGLLILALIALLWGSSSMVSGYDHCGDRSKPRWHHRRWLPSCFEFWLGVYLLLFDMGMCLVIGIITLRDQNRVDLWAFAWIAAAVFAGVKAFQYWARDRIPERHP